MENKSPSNITASKSSTHTLFSILIIVGGVFALALGLTRLILMSEFTIPAYENISKIIHSSAQGLAFLATGIVMLQTKWPRKGVQLPTRQKAILITLISVWVVTSLWRSTIEIASFYGIFR